MAATSEDMEQILKRRLKALLLQMVNFGTVKGFLHYVTYMRGREEMIISIVNEPQVPDNAYSHISDNNIDGPIERKGSFGASLTSGNLPYDKRSLMLSTRSQMTLSGLEDIGVGLPPASPSEHETAALSDDSTLFLLAGYARYNCPYVWVRSNHERLVKMTGTDMEDKNDKDNPLRLKSTARWKDREVHVWDIVGELVRLSCYPSPLNPFSVDWDYFTNLPLSQRVLATGAMLNLLQKIHLSHKEDQQYTPYLLADIHKLTKLHFKCLQLLIQDNSVPSLAAHSLSPASAGVRGQERQGFIPSVQSQHGPPSAAASSRRPVQSAKSNATHRSQYTESRQTTCYN